RLPDIVTVEEAARLFQATNKLSYRVFYFTVYSLGLRLGEGLRLEVGDLDAQRQRVHIRAAKGNKDRFVPLPDVTRDLLRRFWSVHRNPVWLFPNRHGGLKAAGSAVTPLRIEKWSTILTNVAGEIFARPKNIMAIRISAQFLELFAFIPLCSMTATGLVQQQDMLQQVQHILIRYILFTSFHSESLKSL
ncbi:hypothetical protein MNBD_GAMMA08-2504, partial [hydrothermal vent metagenome]